MTSTGILHCVIDIDGTITADIEGRAQINSRSVNNNAVFDVIRDVMISRGWTSMDAERAIVSYAQEHVFWDYPDFIRKFKLPEDTAWARITEWHERNLMVFGDAVLMVYALHQAGFKLHISSNNPRTGCLLKLQRADLGTRVSAPLFQTLFCSDRMHGQKGSDHWWPDLVKQIGADPASIAVIGDNHEQDIRFPQLAGIKRFFIVDRTQPVPVRHQDGVSYLNNLEFVAGLLAAGTGEGVRANQGPIQQRAL